MMPAKKERFWPGRLVLMNRMNRKRVVFGLVFMVVF